MSSVLAFAIQQAVYSIPHELLVEGFFNRTDGFRPPDLVVNPEEAIRREIYYGRVLPALNMVAGECVAVPLYNLPIERYMGNMVVISIPKDRTNNRSIVSADVVSFLPWSTLSNWYVNNGNARSYQGTLGVNNTQLTSGTAASMAVLQSYSTIPWAGTASVELLADNVIRYPDTYLYSNQGYLKCYLEMNDQLQNVSPRLAHKLGTYITLATKSFLWRTLAVKVNQGKLQGGYELGVFKEILDDYRDAEQSFLDMTPSIQRAFLTADPHTRKDLLRLQMGAGR